MTWNSAFFVLTGLLISSPAHAVSVLKEICAEYRVDYSDATDGYYHQTDYFNTNSDKPAWGAYLEVREASTETLVWADYTPWDGANPGCVDLWLDTGTEYQVRIWAKALVNGNYIKVRQEDTNHLVWHTPWSAPFQPSRYGAIGVFKTGVHRAWDFSAAMGWAMVRRNAGLSDETFDAYTDCGCPRTDPNGNPYDCDDLINGKWARFGNCWNDDTESIYANAYLDSKFILVHELGHGVTYHTNDHTGWSKSYDAEGDACPGNTHAHNSKEYNSAASAEGYADYYATVAFNKTDELSCTYWHGEGTGVHWNRATAMDPGNEAWEPYSCYGAPIPNEPLFDYYGYYCEGTGAEDDNRGNEFDWLRFLWEMDQDYSFTTSELFEVFSAADPDTWDATTDGTGPDNPARRLRENVGSVVNATKEAAWLSREVVHGVNH